MSIRVRRACRATLLILALGIGPAAVARAQSRPEARLPTETQPETQPETQTETQPETQTETQTETEGTGAETQRFTADQLREDLEHLDATLRASHHDLFASTPVERFDALRPAIAARLVDGLDRAQACRLLQPYAALARMAHCTLELPVGDYMAHVAAGGALFPLEGRLAEDAIVVSVDHSGVAGLAPGERVLAIDGRPAAEIIADLRAYLAAEDERFGDVLVEQLTLPRLWWLALGEPAACELRVEAPDGRRRTLTLPALPASRFEEAVATRPEPLRGDREFRLLDGLAYLRPGVFSAAGHGDLAGFTTWVDEAFDAMAAADVERLVLDLRGNSGGDNSYSDHLVSYLADRPFWFCSRFSVKVSPTTRRHWLDIDAPGLAALRTAILEGEDGQHIEAPLGSCPPQPPARRFTGRTAVLVDRFTLSNAVVTAAIVQDHGFGTVVGEVTADSPTGYGAVHTFRLPHTGLQVTYPKAFLVRPDGREQVTGLVPDILAAPATPGVDDPTLHAALEWLMD